MPAEPPLLLRQLLAERSVPMDRPLEDVVLEVEAGNATGDFSCVTLSNRAHVHDYAAGPAAPAVVLLHALGGNCLTWLPIVELLRGQARLICLDLPGHGRTPPHPGALRDELVGWLDECLDEMELPVVHLAGHSLGARAAATYAAARADRVSSLTLLAPALRLSRDLPARLLAQSALVAASLAIPAVMAAFVRPVLRGMLIQRDAQTRLFLDYAIADVLRDQRRQRYAGVRSGLGWLRAEPTDSIDWPLLTARMPVRAVFGSGDRHVSAADHAHLALAGASVTTKQGAGHLVPLEAPDLCAAEIRTAVGGLPGR